jgi:hypothetical protein
MNQRSIVSRVILPTVAAAITTSVIAIAITYATAWRDNLWAWLTVGLLTILSAGVSVWLYRQQAQPDTSHDVAGPNEAEIGRKASVGLIEQFGGVASRLKVGDGARVGSVRMGVPTSPENPDADPVTDAAAGYRASSPYYRPRLGRGREPAVPPADDDRM